ncbi:MAG: hypothetical protein ACE5EQ_08365 [Phycisphaerae bacterium]
MAQVTSVVIVATQFIGSAAAIEAVITRVPRIMAVVMAVSARHTADSTITPVHFTTATHSAPASSAVFDPTMGFITVALAYRGF